MERPPCPWNSAEPADAALGLLLQSAGQAGGPDATAAQQKMSCRQAACGALLLCTSSESAQHCIHPRAVWNIRHDTAACGALSSFKAACALAPLSPVFDVHDSLAAHTQHSSFLCCWTASGCLQGTGGQKSQHQQSAAQAALGVQDGGVQKPKGQGRGSPACCTLLHLFSSV